MAKMQMDASQSDDQYAQVDEDSMNVNTGDYDDDDLGPGAQGPGTHPHQDADDRSVGNHPHQDDRSNGEMDHPHRGLNKHVRT